MERENDGIPDALYKQFLKDCVIEQMEIAKREIFEKLLDTLAPKEINSLKTQVKKLADSVSELTVLNFQQQIFTLDKKVDELKADLTTKITEIQDSLRNLEQSAISQRRQSYQAFINALELYVKTTVHQESGGHGLISPDRKLNPSRSPARCINHIQTYLMKTREQLVQASEMDKMEEFYKKLLQDVNDALIESGYTPINRHP